MAGANMVQEDEILGKAYDSRLMSRLLTYLRPYRKQVALAVVLLFVTTGMDLAGPFLFKQAVDNGITPGNYDVLTSLALIYLGTIAAGFVFRYTQNYVMQIIGQKVMYDMRQAIFSHLQRQSLSYFDRTAVGRLISRLTSDVDALNEFIGSGVVSVVGDVVMLLGVIIFMLFLDWRLALITMSVLPLIALASWFFQKLMRTSYRQQRVRLARLNAFLQENLSGMLVVQLFNREKRQFGEFDKMNESYREANIVALRIFSIFAPIVNFLGTIAVALLIWYGSGEILAGTLTFGVLLAFFQYSDRAFQPIRDMAEKYNIMQAAMAAAERVFMLLDEKSTVLDPEHPKTLGKVVGDIEFKDVHFAYNPNEPVLRGVSFKIPAGTSVAIVGATGAGKTSMISLLSRFYDVQEGAITLDGVDVRDVNQMELRKHIGVVLQDPVLFSGTIERNIRLLDEGITDEEVKRAAEYVNASHFIDQFEDGYQHEVKERGTNLSVGQRQLLTFARAIAFNPSVLLVMDEATSSVDTETEALIQDALLKLMRGRTSIIIAHRLSTIKHVDRIIVLHKGLVVEEGSHEELLARNGYYYRLYQLQYQEQEGATSVAGLGTGEQRENVLLKKSA